MADDTKPKVTVAVARRAMTRDPEIHGFFLSMQSETGAWEDGYGSEAEAAAWLRGAEAMARMLGHYDIRVPSVPDRNEAKE